MGQKLNPTIFRLGVNKTWKTEFFEKKPRELPLYVFKDLEIKNYIERIFETQGIIVHDYKQHYNASTLNLYVSYFVTPDFMLARKKDNEQIIVKNAEGNQNLVKKVARKNQLLYSVSFKEMDCHPPSGFSVSYKIKQYLKLNSHFQLRTQTSLMKLKEVKPHNGINQHLHSRNSRIEGFIEQILTVLNAFLGNQLDIAAHFCCINKNIQFLKFTKKKTFTSFQKFRNTPFFKEGIELLFNVVYGPDSANLLAKFIAFQFKKVKRHKFLLSFLKQILSILLASKLAKIKGIKIIVKGRLNGLPRAKHKIIVIGDVPAQTLSAKLDYAQSTAHNSNGSYGIKVWVVEK